MGGRALDKLVAPNERKPTEQAETKQNCDRCNTNMSDEGSAGEDLDQSNELDWPHRCTHMCTLMEANSTTACITDSTCPEAEGNNAPAGTMSIRKGGGNMRGGARSRCSMGACGRHPIGVKKGMWAQGSKDQWH